MDVTGSMTQSFGKVGALALRIDQLYELAGKRGYRQESARYGVQSAEASFADAVRTLGFAVKDAFYHVLQAKQKLELAKQNSANFAEVVKINDIRFKKGAIPEVDVIKLRVQLVDFQNQVITATQDYLTAQNNLRGLLGLKPTVALNVAGDLEYKSPTLSVETLKADALLSRPDVLGKTRDGSQKDAKLKLARAFPGADVTIGAGTTLDGAPGHNTP